MKSQQSLREISFPSLKMSSDCDSEDYTITRDGLYRAMFEHIIEDHVLINCSREVTARESKLSVRSVTPFMKTQVNFLNGNQFFGKINECKLTESGRYLWGDDMSVYEGEFKRPNVIEGRGIFKDQNCERATKYCGNFLNGMFHGHGQLTNFFFKYDGNFECNKMHGKGNFKSGMESFEGCFKVDKKVYGKRVYYEGFFVGDFHSDETRKFGTYEFDNGDVYHGSFVNGKFEGFGEYNWNLRNGLETKYIGNWRQNQRDGVGAIKVDGFTCVAVFKKNVKDGPALFLAKNGKVYASNKMFQNDEFLESQEVEISYENIEILRQILSQETLQVDNFKAKISILLANFSRVIDKLIFPFHVPWFELKVEHSVIWDFVRNFPKTNINQEFISIKQAIKEHVEIFQQLYSRYSDFSSKAAGRNSGRMTRVGLWQLMRDLEIYKKSSTFNTQEILEAAEFDFKILVINPNDPFEAISIADLVQYLMYLTLHMNQHHDFVLSCALNQRSKIFGLFATMFVIFVREFLSPSIASTGMVPKLVRDDRTFFSNFLNVVSLEDQNFSIRNVFKIVEMWKNCGGEFMGK